jgi:drug/metabolite transporter (DMT)-like permease
MKSWKGFLFALLVLIGNGLQPIINNSRPADLDSALFAWITIIIECIGSVPIVLLEKKQRYRTPDYQSLSKIWSQYWKKLIIVGLIFAIATYLVIYGYSSTDSISGAVAVKTQPISMLFIGALVLQEKITGWQLFFTGIMLTSIYYMTTKGTWDPGQFSTGFIALLIAPILWNIGHSLVKPFLQTKKMTTPQLIFFRTLISTIILGTTYLIITGSQFLWQIFQWEYFLSMFLMGVNYLILHYFWYRTITEIKLTVATAIIIPAPVITTISAYFITHEYLQYYHLIGMVGSISALYGLMWAENHKDNSNHQK